ncbi:PREDICTED: tumor necrosis factor ligand superfamily member 8 [Crocodylus porosus]|uniref:tumor necrosis factor ligand superfamily member 8 n=1 Tax=Crocodylus porosus TaxID=8502 RepID=UPI00093C78A1|nr:PREDICTED: tumor necrosis factor ligand superfamily member 8 [Crocodylus porosus]
MRSRGDTDCYTEDYIRMCSPQEQTFFQVNDSHEAAIKMTEDSVSRRPMATDKSYFYFTTAFLSVCLVFALATIMILIVQKTGPTPEKPGNTLHFVGGNDSELFLRILKNVPFKTAAAYMRALKPNNTELKWTEYGVRQDIQFHEGIPVIQTQGLYLIFCHLNFNIHNCSGDTIDIKLQMFVNGDPRRQTIDTLCTSNEVSKRIYKEFFQLFLEYLNVNDRISVQIDKYQYLDFAVLPNENVLGVFRYSN